MGFFMRKSDFITCKQQRCISASISTQFDMSIFSFFPYHMTSRLGVKLRHALKLINH